MYLKVNENVNVLGEDFKKGDIVKVDEKKAGSLMGLKPSFFQKTEKAPSPAKKVTKPKPKAKVKK